MKATDRRENCSIRAYSRPRPTSRRMMATLRAHGLRAAPSGHTSLEGALELGVLPDASSTSCRQVRIALPRSAETTGMIRGSVQSSESGGLGAERRLGATRGNAGCQVGASYPAFLHLAVFLRSDRRCSWSRGAANRIRRQSTLNPS